MIPHVIPYQGSKRKLAPQILNFVRFDVEGRIFEPFAGSAAVTLAAASSSIGNGFVLGDCYLPLVQLWELIIQEPATVFEGYSRIWHEQLADPQLYFASIRDQFNRDQDPIKFLYLVARCVKNSIRFNSDGEFNQSADNRRLGMRPAKLQREVNTASKLLRGRSRVMFGDFARTLEEARSEDLVYLDPPWQGTSGNRDPRYAQRLDLALLLDGLADLNRRQIPYILSFDGICGTKRYGNELPNTLRLKKVELDAGRSSQATLLGRNETTVESLYLSPTLIELNSSTKRIESQSDFSWIQETLFESFP